MPFEDDEIDIPENQKVKLKNVSAQKSMFDNIPKKPSQDEFQEKVKKAQDTNNNYKIRGAELASKFFKILNDKTLKQNKNIFAEELEKEILTEMIQLAAEINNDPNEQEGMGSLSWITLLLKTCFMQRDKINDLEYAVFQIQKKIEDKSLSEIISKEIVKALDSKKNSE